MTVCPMLPLDLKPSQVQRLEQWAVAGSTPQQVALRCRIALKAGRGDPVLQIARAIVVPHPTVLVWRDRVANEGIGTVWDIAPSSGRKPEYGKPQVARLVNATLEDQPNGLARAHFNAFGMIISSSPI